MKPVAYFVRHGETTLNKKNAFRGPKDIDLDEGGKKQAEELADYFKGRSFSGAYTSSKKRSKQTMAEIAKKIKTPKPKVVKNFDAWNVGELAGKPKDEDNLKIVKHYQDNPDEKIPGGERLNDFRKRLDPKIMMVIHKGESSEHPTIAAVHSSTIHQISHLFHGDHTKVKIRPGGVVGIFKTAQGYVPKVLVGESQDNKDSQFGS